MAKFQINLIQVGRNKVDAEFKKEFKSWEDAEDFAYTEADSHLASDNTALSRQTDTNAIRTFSVIAGFHTVGQVEIRKLT